jgi:hypothetical protein
MVTTIRNHSMIHTGSSAHGREGLVHHILIALTETNDLATFSNFGPNPP